MDNVSTAVHWIKLPWDLTPLHISCGIFPLETFGLVVGFSLTTSDVICWLLYTVHQPKQWTLVRRPLCSVDRTLRTCSHCWVRHHQLKESDDILDRGWKNSRILTFLILSFKSPWSSWIVACYNRVYLYARGPFFIPFNCSWCLTFTQIFLVVYMDVFFFPKEFVPKILSSLLWFNVNIGIFKVGLCQ